MVVRSAPYDAFEVLRLTGDNKALSVARIEVDKDVDKAEAPRLKLSQASAAERCVDATSMASIETAVLGKWSDEESTDFELRVEGSADRIKFVLHGHRGYHPFRWGLEFLLIDGEVIVRGPAILDDPLS
jgi:hypothetical protein